MCEPFLDVNVRYHRPIVSLINCEKPKTSISRRKVWLYEQGDYIKYRSKLESINWDSIIDTSQDINEITNDVSKKILDTASSCIPNRVVAIRKDDLPWITKEIKHLIRKRNRLRKKAKKTKSTFIYNKFKVVRNKVVNLLRNAQALYYKSLYDKINNNKFGSKDWWKLVKQISNLSSKQSGINVLHSENGKTISDDSEKANLLNVFFASQSVINDQNVDIQQFENPSTSPSDILDKIEITPQNVIDILNTLDTTKAVGPDKISPKLLKEASQELSVPLSKLFNLSLMLKKYPENWKYADVVPVFKKGDPKIVNNYRPISLLSIISKVFEKCVYKYIHNFINNNNLLSQHQSGFRKGDSTINQLLYLSHQFSSALDNGKEVRVVFFDISKAFDRVWHSGLLYKIEQFGISGGLLLWIKSYLSGRKQKVIINGQESELIEINAGVPQGSILGPLFFLIFINDIVNDICCNIKLFADDTSIYLIIDNPVTSAEKLNVDLSIVHAWSNKWLVNFNPNKTESLLISRKTQQVPNPTLFFNHLPVNEVTIHKHLGLTFNNTFHWNNHIESIILKANQKLNILRSLKFELDRKTLQIMYFSFVRPVLEYADIIFDNCTSHYCDKLESVNLEAARIVTGATKLTSLSLLYNECGWEKLRTRREKHKLIMFYKIKNSLVPEYLSQIVPPVHNEFHSYDTRNSNNFAHIQSRTTNHLNSFFPSCVRIWNDLPTQIKNSSTLTSFKKALDKHYNPVNIPPYYFIGTRRGQILHARLRTRCSALNQHLYYKNLVPDPVCTCGSGDIESNSHYLLHCTLFTEARANLLLSIDAHITCDLLLFGDETKSFDFNKNVFERVQEFIINSKRFC